MRGGTFLNGKEGRVGFRIKPFLMVRKDGMLTKDGSEHVWKYGWFPTKLK